MSNVSFLVFLLQDSYESLDLKELQSADFSEIKTTMNYSESHIFQRLRQVQWLFPMFNTSTFCLIIVNIKDGYFRLLIVFHQKRYFIWVYAKQNKKKIFFKTTLIKS